jgi:hypothetical protein
MSSKGDALVEEVLAGRTDLASVQAEHDQLDVDLQDAFSGTPHERVRKFVTREVTQYFSRKDSR